MYIQWFYFKRLLDADFILKLKSNFLYQPGVSVTWQAVHVGTANGVVNSQLLLW